MTGRTGQWRDDARLLDMLIAARKVLAYVSGMTREAFDGSELVQDAVVRRLEVIGEAAGEVSDARRLTHPSIPWRDIIGMRNRLIHEYFRVDLQKVWDTVKDDVPPLIAALERIVPPPRET